MGCFIFVRVCVGKLKAVQIEVRQESFSGSYSSCIISEGCLCRIFEGVHNTRSFQQVYPSSRLFEEGLQCLASFFARTNAFEAYDDVGLEGVDDCEDASSLLKNSRRRSNLHSYVFMCLLKTSIITS